MKKKLNIVESIDDMKSNKRMLISKQPTTKKLSEDVKGPTNDVETLADLNITNKNVLADATKKCDEKDCECPQEKLVCKANKRIELIKKSMEPTIKTAEEVVKETSRKKDSIKESKKLDGRKIMKLREAFEDTSKIKEFIEESIKDLTENDFTCSEYSLGDNLVIAIGWINGDEDDTLYNYKDGDRVYNLAAGIKIPVSYMKTDFEYDYVSPYYEDTGDVIDTETLIDVDDTPDTILKRLKEIYDEIKDLTISDEGVVLEESDCSHLKEDSSSDDKFRTKTKLGYDIVKVFKDLKDYGRLHVIVKRPRDFAIGLGYDYSRGEWAQGRYDYKTLEDAEKALKDDYEVREVTDRWFDRELKEDSSGIVDDWIIEKVKEDFSLEDLKKVKEIIYKILDYSEDIDLSKAMSAIVSIIDKQQPPVSVIKKECVNESVDAGLTEKFKELLSELDFDVYKDSNGSYRLYDRQGVNLGSIDEETFEDAREIADRLDIYYEDYFFKELEDKFESYKDELKVDDEQMPFSMEGWIDFYEKLKKSNPEIAEKFEYQIDYFKVILDAINEPDKINLDMIIIKNPYED